MPFAPERLCEATTQKRSFRGACPLPDFCHSFMSKAADGLPRPDGCQEAGAGSFTSCPVNRQQLSYRRCA